MKNKITLNRLKTIISEEISMLVNEDSSKSDKVAKLVLNASKLMKALEGFRDNVSDMKAIDAVSPHLDSLLRIMDQMVDHASTYVDDPKVEPKKRVFKLSKEKDVM